MATYYLDTYKEGLMPNTNVPAGTVISQAAVYTTPTLAAGDIIYFANLPQGARLIGVWLFYSAAGGSGATGQLAVGGTQVGPTQSLTSATLNTFFPGMNTETGSDSAMRITLGTAGFTANTVLTFITVYLMSFGADTTT